MKNLFTMFLFVIAAATATAQLVEDFTDRNESEQSGSQTTNETDPLADRFETPNNLEVPGSATPTNPAPKWETREGLEEAARNYFQAKQEYKTCRGYGDRAGMARAERSMRSFSNQLSAFKRQQAVRDHNQDRRLDIHGGLVRKHEYQLNGKNGLAGRVKSLEEDMDAAGPAIAGITSKFDGLTWWVLILTIIVIIGFTRRYWINR